MPDHSLPPTCHLCAQPILDRKQIELVWFPELDDSTCHKECALEFRNHRPSDAERKSRYLAEQGKKDSLSD